jgi:hypothetical protein
VAVLTLTLAAYAQKTNDWKPDPKYLPGLADIAKEDSFTIRPPLHYTRQAMSGPANSKVVAYVSEPREDGIRGWIMITTTPIPAEEREKATLDRLLTSMLNSVRNNRSEWTQTKAEKGTINGCTFLRSYWTGHVDEQNLDMKGFVYAGRRGNSMILLTSQDIKGREADLLRAEASALSWKPVPPVAPDNH